MYIDFNPRLTFTKTQNNILMSQIGAEKKSYHNKPEHIIFSHRDETQTGKRIFKEHLFSLTATDREDQRSKSRSKSPNIHTGKRVGYIPPGEVKSPIAAGKRRVPLLERSLN